MNDLKKKIMKKIWLVLPLSFAVVAGCSAPSYHKGAMENSHAAQKEAAEKSDQQMSREAQKIKPKSTQKES